MLRPVGLFGLLSFVVVGCAEVPFERGPALTPIPSAAGDVDPQIADLPIVAKVESDSPRPAKRKPSDKEIASQKQAAPVYSGRSLDELVGLEFWQIESMIGRPTFDEVKPPARVWTYNSKDCISTILFYPQVGGETFRALTYEATAIEGAPASAAETCLDELLTASAGDRAEKTKGTQ